MKRQKKPTNEKVIATLTMVVEYESLPDSGELEQLIEKARELGGVTQADFTVHRSVTQSLV